MMTPKETGGRNARGGGSGYPFQVTGQESTSSEQLKGLALAWGEVDGAS